MLPHYLVKGETPKIHVNIRSLFNVSYKLQLSFSGLFSRATWVSRHQKGRTKLDFTEARDDGWQTGSGISWTIYRSLAPRSRQITTPFHLGSRHHLGELNPQAQARLRQWSKHWTETQKWRPIAQLSVCRTSTMVSSERNELASTERGDFKV